MRQISKRNSVFFVLIPLFYLIAIGPPWLVSETIFRRSTGNVAVADSTRICLLRIEDRTVGLVKNTTGKETIKEITYGATVICEYQGLIEEGIKIQIHGDLDDVGSRPKNIPDFDTGTIVLICGKTTNVKNNFEYCGQIDLPVGLQAPCEIEKAEIEDLKEALLKLGSISKLPDSTLDTAAAEKLINNENNNYFLWALGVTGFAVEGSKSNVERLVRIYSKENTNLRQVLWLNHCLKWIVPSANRPGIDDRYELLVQFLKTKVESPGL
jgi:hypothetical protein